jgi:hypothetical protein
LTSLPNLASTGALTISGTTHGVTIPAGTAVSGAAGSVIYASDATNGFAEVNENNTGLARLCTAANGICTSGGLAYTSPTVGFIPKVSSTSGSGTVVNSALDDGATTTSTLTYSGTGGIKASAGPLTSSNPSGGVGSSLFLTQEGTIPTGLSAASQDNCYTDSTQHGVLCNFNAGTTLPLVQGPASETTGHLATWSGTNGGRLVDGGAVPTGTVTAVSVASANGVSGSSSGGATPALTIALGAITPTSVVPSTPFAHANIAATAVTPGSYTSANITVAADGSITLAANGTGFQGVDGNAEFVSNSSTASRNTATQSIAATTATAITGAVTPAYPANGSAASNTVHGQLESDCEIFWTQATAVATVQFGVKLSAAVTGMTVIDTDYNGTTLTTSPPTVVTTTAETSTSPALVPTNTTGTNWTTLKLIMNPGTANSPTVTLFGNTGLGTSALNILPQSGCTSWH